MPWRRKRYGCTLTPLVLPHPLSFPRGGGGRGHLVNTTKSLVTAHCVVVWVTVLLYGRL